MDKKKSARTKAKETKEIQIIVYYRACVYYSKYSQRTHCVISLEINARTHIYFVVTHVNESIEDNKLLTHKKKTMTTTEISNSSKHKIFLCVCVLIKKTLVMMVKGERRER
jgi:hypothetical protein